MAKGETYEQFIEKFRSKPASHVMTTDDCYTPREVYEALLGWAEQRYGLQDTVVVRPFYPGGDYEHHDYPDGCIVIDNPPFGIYRKVVRFYLKRGIRFVLFAPTKTMTVTDAEVCYIVTGVTITYENGAEIETSFITNMEPDTRILTSSTLREALCRANRSSEAYRAKHKASQGQPGGGRFEEIQAKEPHVTRIARTHRPPWHRHSHPCAGREVRRPFIAQAV